MWSLTRAASCSIFTGDSRVRALFNWTAAGEWIVSLSDVQEADGAWRSGWFRFTHAGEPQLEAIRELTLDDPEQIFYTLGVPYAAAIGERADVLMIAEPPSLLEIDGGGRRRRLASFPEGFATRPSLPARTEAATTAGLMAAVEQATMPAGLFAHGGRLYVLDAAATGRRRRHDLGGHRDRSRGRPGGLAGAAAHDGGAPGRCARAGTLGVPREGAGSRDVGPTGANAPVDPGVGVGVGLRGDVPRRGGGLGRRRARVSRRRATEVLLLRVYARGARTWMLAYRRREDNRRQQVSLGPYPGVSLKQAPSSPRIMRQKEDSCGLRRFGVDLPKFLDLRQMSMRLPIEGMRLSVSASALTYHMCNP